MVDPLDNRSVPQLLSDAAHETSELIRSEVQLARTEISEKLSQIGSGVGLLAAGGMVAFAGVLMLLLSAVFGLANVVAPWVSALIIGAIVAIVAAVMVSKGRSNLKPANLAPNRTIHSVEKDAEVARSEFRR